MKLRVVIIPLVCVAFLGAPFVFGDSAPPFLVEEQGSPIYPGATAEVPSAHVGKSSGPIEFTIVNRYSAELQLAEDSAVVVDGVDRRAYHVLEQPESSVAPGGEASFALSFNPTSLGEKDATVMIRFGDNADSSYVFYVVANGLSNRANEDQ